MSFRKIVGFVFLCALSGSLLSCGKSEDNSHLLRIRQWEDLRRFPGDSLVTILEDGSQLDREIAARAIGLIGDPAGRSALEKALHEEKQPAIRAEAAFGLGILSSPDAVPALIRRLQSETDPVVLGEIALAIGRLGEENTAAALLPLLKLNSRTIREQALEALALLADSTTVEALIEATEDPLGSVVWRAAYALEKIPPTEASIDRLIQLCDHPSNLVRRYAVRSLGRLEAKEALPVLTGLLEQTRRSWQLRVMIAQAAGRIGGDEAESILAKASVDTSFHVRSEALGGLALLEAEDQVHRIIPRCEDSSVNVRGAAYRALAACLKAHAWPNLVEGLKDPSPSVVAECLRNLGETGRAQAVDLLLDALDHPVHPSIRYAAIEGLGKLGEDAPLQRLRQALMDEDWVVATTAAQVLGDLEDHSSAPLLIQICRDRRGAGSIDFRWQAIQTLGQLESAEAIDFLREALEKEDDVRLRLAAREALSDLLDEVEAALLPGERQLREDIRPAHRSPEQPVVVMSSKARQLILQTPRGRILIDFYYQQAPQTVENFARLAEKGFFDKLTFHRVVPNFVVQGGDPLGNGWGDCGYTIRSEWSPLQYERGMVGIAHSGKDTGSCQLFITHSPQPHLNARYTIFGKVVEGMEIVDRIQVEDTFTAEVVWVNGGNG